MWTVPPESPESKAIKAVASRSDGPPIAPTWRVTVNFHPDRVFGDASLLAALAKDGFLRSQFETRTSNGGLTAFEGGDRWRWESRIFSGAYDRESACRRPKYGALNYQLRAVGASPRFGSSHFRLKAHVLQRTTFCYPDSVFEPRRFGNASCMGLIEVCDSDQCDDLDRYIEAHVHGPVDLSKDVEALVLDSCYAGTRVEADALTLPVPIEWHSGFRVAIDVVKQFPEYRGQRYVDLAGALAVDGWLTPSVIGSASWTGKYANDDLKKVWHYLARFSQIEDDRTPQLTKQ
ncbi:MAG: DUF3626 domain-containing protein [Planctomycetales bacterium]|nr:DUF3626 domain-containing protein [Planctomycetales bacterium]MCA9207080.1 DUF3626 domain-containing protein [Planctomycetales bacterium]